MSNARPLNVVRYSCIGGVGCFLYYLLLLDDLLPFSIAAVMSNMNDLTGHGHVFVVGFLPIYVALMIFGAGVFAIYLGSFLQKRLSRFFSFTVSKWRKRKDSSFVSK